MSTASTPELIHIGFQTSVPSRARGAHGPSQVASGWYYSVRENTALAPAQGVRIRCDSTSTAEAKWAAATAATAAAAAVTSGARAGIGGAGGMAPLLGGGGGVLETAAYWKPQFLGDFLGAAFLLGAGAAFVTSRRRASTSSTSRSHVALQSGRPRPRPGGTCSTGGGTHVDGYQLQEDFDLECEAAEEPEK